MNRLEFLKKHKKLVAIVTAASIGATVITIASSINKKREYDNATSGLTNYGYLLDSYGTIQEGTLEESDDQIIGKAVELTKNILNDNGKDNYAFIKVSGYNIDENEINSLIQSGKSVGLIVEPFDNTYSSIYDTVDYIKKLVAKHDIKAPILYDISKYMDSDDIDANCKLGEAFVEKLAYNGCYTGFYGSQNDLKKYADNYGKTRDKSLRGYEVMTKVNYDYLEDVISNKQFHYICGNLIEVDGIVLSKSHLVEIIKENNLNSKDNFKDDPVYTVKTGEYLSSIAEENKIRYDILGDYNGFNGVYNTLKPGDNLVIPNGYQNILNPVYNADKDELNYTYFRTEMNDLHGIDVSEFQGKIDWEKVKKEIDYCIIRIRDFAVEKDKYFEYNIKECNRLGIPVGVYYLPRFTNVDEAKKQAEYVVNELKKYDVKLPVYLDIEDPYLVRLMKKEGYGNIQFEEMINASFDVIREAGYRPGLYGDQNDMKYSLSFDCDYMFVNHETYFDKIKFSEIEPHSLFNEEYYYLTTPDQWVVKSLDEYQSYICQHTECGKVAGIDGNVDLEHTDGIMKLYLDTKEEDRPKIKIYS